MDYRQLADATMLAGTIMLQAGAETYRVEDTMQRILNTSGAETREVLVLSTALMLTLDDPEFSAITKMQRITTRETNLGNLYTVNNLSRQYCAGALTLEELYAELKELRETPRYPVALLYFSNFLTVVMFTLLLGGDGWDALISCGSGLVLVLCQMAFSKSRLNPFMYHMIALAFATFAAAVLQSFFHPGCNLELIVAGTAMPSLPGVAITNAIRDTLHGDYISGSARVMEAFVRAISCAVGIAIGLYFGSMMTGGVL